MVLVKEVSNKRKVLLGHENARAANLFKLIGSLK